VNCALDIQRTSKADFDADLRIGIHLGDITIENNDVYGDGVNVAARLESIADPGGIYISESIEKAIRGQSNVQAKYLGESKLKNVEYRVPTYAVQGVGLPIPEVKREEQLKGHLWAEVQRRSILRAGATYIVLSLLSILLLPYVQSVVNLPLWFSAALMGILIAGFPLALYLAWNYERSPAGFVKTSSKESWQNPYQGSQRKPLTSNFIIAGMALIIVVSYIFPRFRLDNYSQLFNDTALETAAVDKSIAVLPFINMSNDPKQEYFSAGMMEEILNHLYRIEDLRVPSRTTSMKYKDTRLSATEIAAEIGVTHILEGSVRKDYNRLRITVQLIDAVNDKHLWAESYDGLLSDTIFVIQSKIAKKIASSLSVVITPDEEERIDKIPTKDIAAYDLCIRANHERWLYLQTNKNKHLIRAYDLYEKALKIDPNYVLAVIGKGQTYNAEFKADSALKYANKAIALDPEFNRSYGLKGYCYSIMGKRDLALEYFLKAIDLPPKDDFWFTYHSAIGQLYLRAENNVIRALPYLRKGIREGSQYSSSTYGLLAGAYLAIGDYKRAEEYLIKSLEVEFNCIAIYRYSWLLIVQGKFQEALQFADSSCQKVECELACSLSRFEASMLLCDFEKAEQYFYTYQNEGSKARGYYNTNRMNPQIGYIYYQQGKSEDAELFFDEQIQKTKSRIDAGKQYRSNYKLLAQIYAFQGDRNEALKYLYEYAELGFDNGDHDFILLDPFFESLRDDPEFKAIVKKAQEEKAAIRAQVKEMEERGELDL